MAHYNAMPLLLPNPAADGDDMEPKPYAIPLDDDTFIKWMDYECDPTGDDFEHLGSEWDWLLFFWNLYTQGATSSLYTPAEINSVWDDTSNIAYLCCEATDLNPDPNKEYWEPSNCSPKNPSGFCALPYRSFTIGKLWEADGDFYATEGVRNQAYQTYAASNWFKYIFFRDTGSNAGIDY